MIAYFCTLWYNISYNTYIWRIRMKKLDNRFVQTLIYVFGYANIITACLASGYILIKDEDEQNRRAAKISLIVSAIFTGISAILALYYNIVIGLAGVYIGSGAYDVYSYLSNIANIAKIVVFAVLIIMIFVNKQNANVTKQTSANANTTQQTSDDAVQQNGTYSDTDNTQQSETNDFWTDDENDEQK